MDAAVQAVISKINKKQGAGTVVLGSEISRPFITRIPSGSLSLDVALGGGWPTNHWSEIVGHESGGKSMLVLKTIAANQRRDPNWTVVWFASEDFVESYAQMLGCDLDRIIVIHENILEEVGNQAAEFIETRAVDSVVIDSLPAMISRREQDGSMDDFQPGLLAFLTGKFFRKLGYGMNRSVVDDERPVTGLVVNQWREKIGGYGNPRTTPGGKGKNFAYFIRVDVKRDEWIKNTKGEPIGQILKISNVKNKQAPPGRHALIDAYFANGKGFKAGEWDVVKDTIAAGLAYGLIEQGGGGYYSFGGFRWHGRDEMTAVIREDQDLHEKIYSAVLFSTTGVEVSESQPIKVAKRTVKKARHG